MKSFQIFTLSTTLALVLLGCSSGGRYLNVPGRQCPAGHKPIDFEARQKSKTWEKGNNENALPAGTYNYQRADFIYTAKGTDGAIIHVEDIPVKADTFKAQTYCVRNAQDLLDKNLTAAATAASKIIAANGPANVDAKQISFRLDNEGRLLPESKALPKKNGGLEENLDKNTSFFLVKNAGEEYELISKGSDDKGDYVMSVKYLRTN